MWVRVPPPPQNTEKDLATELYKRVRTINTRKQSELEILETIQGYIKTNNIKIEMTIVDGKKRKVENEDNNKDGNDISSTES